MDSCETECISALSRLYGDVTVPRRDWCLPGRRMCYFTDSAVDATQYSIMQQLFQRNLHTNDSRLAIYRLISSAVKDPACRRIQVVVEKNENAVLTVKRIRRRVFLSGSRRLPNELMRRVIKENQYI